MLVGAAEAINKPATLGPLLGIDTLLYTGINTLHSLCLTHIALDRTVSFGVTLSVPLDLGQAGLFCETCLI